MNTDQQHDEEIWRLAKARVDFKWSLMAYFVINASLVAFWFLTSSHHHYFWPIWPIMGWGIGIVFQYFHAYHGNKVVSVRNEYEKLKNKQ